MADSGEGSNIWSWITGAVGMVFVLPPILMAIMSQTPLRKIKQLDNKIRETRAFLDDVEDKRILRDGPYIALCRRRLTALELEAGVLKLSAYAAGTTGQQLQGLLTGLSISIHSLGQIVNALRAEIAEAISKEDRQRRPGMQAPPPPPPHSASESLRSFLADEDTEVGRRSVDIADLSDLQLRILEIHAASDTPDEWAPGPL
ncbi:hypothetical protein FOMPIDRAFT_1047865 [Fomitopsis schrenkii]|uniref:Uncharacterized protein n=1 Tax=Fomitopsis schrenkii TaxID=2126942 RepID=S8FMG2_FOMSC|nr:hypothetical protein FOMPIDRAFT_1047865 [Fomitopsis schrenkii]